MIWIRASTRFKKNGRRHILEMKTSGYAGNAGMDGIMQAAKLLVGKGRICNVQKNEIKENH